MSADIDRQKLRELCERATKAPADPLVYDKQSGSRFFLDDAADFYAACWRFFRDDAFAALLALTDAQAAKIAELRAENASLRERADAPEDRTWFWEIVDRDGLANVGSDERQALADICRAVAERDQLRKQVEGQFVAGMQKAAEIAKNIRGTASFGSEYYCAVASVQNHILSAASALEQKEQG